MFYSPTFGRLTKKELIKTIRAFVTQEKNSSYKVIVGVDSQKNKEDQYDFVLALVIQRVGKGGIYFWKREMIHKKIVLKQRMYMEALMSLQFAEELVEFLKEVKLDKYGIEIHVDIGQNGKTKDLISEIVGMVRANGYDVKIKPDSFGASYIADRHA